MEKFKKNEIVYKEALNYNPKEYQFYYNLGMTYTRINDFANARDNYKKAATINSLQDISNLSIGQIYLIFEEYDEAEKIRKRIERPDFQFAFCGIFCDFIFPFRFERKDVFHDNGLSIRMEIG